MQTEESNVSADTTETSLTICLLNDHSPCFNEHIPCFNDLTLKSVANHKDLNSRVRNRVKNMKISNYGNIIITMVNEEGVKEVFERTDLFLPNCNRMRLSEKSETLVQKSFSIMDIKNNKCIENVLKYLGLKKFCKISEKCADDLKLVKVYFANEKVRNNILLKSYNGGLEIKLGDEIVIFIIEPNIHPHQFNRCKKLNHFTDKFLSVETICAKCNKLGHNAYSCRAKKPRFANCNGEHNAYFKGCTKYKIAKMEAFKSIIEKIPGFQVKQFQNMSFQEKRAEYNQVCGVTKDLETVNSRINTMILSQSNIETQVQALASIVTNSAKAIKKALSSILNYVEECFKHLYNQVTEETNSKFKIEKTERNKELKNLSY